LTVVVINKLAGFCYEMHSRQYIHEAYDICGDACIMHMQCQITNFQNIPSLEAKMLQRRYIASGEVPVIID
jgi:hypothetical protein